MTDTNDIPNLDLFPEQIIALLEQRVAVQEVMIDQYQADLVNLTDIYIASYALIGALIRDNKNLELPTEQLLDIYLACDNYDDNEDLKYQGNT